ncbi:multifunctional CCA addition/repair protein [Legionella bozemanae]|uniref:Multifunctional CCA protein n=1 Tax=Legionella bozemanae TaxID=447 RepID=A0A0W0S2B8_LEGBO|nr:multifunctional CCA addition/repair protein [Legionella bozemanae]KTC77305.1 tRNA nucleotidyltransferase [Legionella bozemanae]STO32620.1 Multifunctional CCA protein [Legionella bozemanae]
MKVYLVGGAVRDQLLNLPVKERDWVVVGSSSDELLAKGFRKVGRDFPVFLHPKTSEEYALARTERKSASGYYGFSCDFDKTVTLEEDLVRRDLTINAIAQDEEGQLIDPFNGKKDIEAKLLRHVSPAFVEDPVRVLRVARFAARFHHLGFKLADETRALMYTMVQRGELAHLVPERVWQEWQKSLGEKNPEQFIATLRSCDALRVILPELDALFGIPNPYRYHHEVDTGIHTLLVLHAAVTLTADPVIRFAALVHDLGKALSPANNWPSHHGHEERGVPIIEALCSRLRIPNDYRTLATMVSRFHLNIHRLSELQASTIVRLLEQCDAFRRPQLFYNMLIACESDAKGCGRDIEYRQSKLWSYLLTECAKVNSQAIIAEGYKDDAIKQALHQRRVACVELILNSWKTNEK